MTDLLGSLAFYQLADPSGLLPYTRDQLAEAFRELGLDEQFLPPPVTEADAFRVASSGITDAYEVDGKAAKLSTKETTGATSPVVRRNVNRTATDGAGRVTTAKVAELQFFRPRRTEAGYIHGTADVTYDIKPDLSPAESAYVGQAIRGFLDRYRRQRENLSLASARTVLRNYLTYIDAAPVEGMGGWFVPSWHDQTLGDLRELALRWGPGSYFHVVPLVDIPQMREMVAGAVEAETEDQVRLLLKDFTRQAADRMPVEVFDRFAAELVGINARVVGYGGLLGVQLPRSCAALGSLKDALRGQELAELSYAPL